MKWSGEMRLLRPCKDHLALEGGALPKAADFCRAISGNVDKEHFILEKSPAVELAIGAFHLPFPSNWPDTEFGCVWDKESGTKGTGNQGVAPAF